MSDPAAVAAVLRLLAARNSHATVCPSEVARTLAAAGRSDDWRSYMHEVHDAVDTLVASGRVQLSWKSEPMVRRDGPYRIGRLE